MDEIAADPDSRPEEGELAVLVPLLRERGRPVKVTISLDAGTLEAIDAETTHRGLTRSGFLTSAALDKIREPTRPTRRTG
jgi:hypothetical protein